MNSIKYITVCILLAVVSGCDTDQLSAIETDGSAPGPVLNVEAEPLPGAARLTYTLPSDPDLLYVQAIYKNKAGRDMEFKGSYYTNTLTVDGFPDTEPRTVDLYTVDRSGNRSTPVTIQVIPKTPPVLTTFETIVIEPDFGGASISFINTSKADLAIVVTTPDSTGNMAVARTFYTARDTASFSVRGYESVSRPFGVFVRDRWGNESDVLLQELVPIYEVELDKTKFRELSLPGDSRTNEWGGAMPYVWDGRVTGDVPGFGLHTGNASTGVPKIITFDLGVEAQLSRFSLQTVQDDRHWYNDVSPKRYEVWGTTSYNPNGSLDGWTKLLSITNIKPSGLPIGLFTDDDRTAGRAGDEANVPNDMPRVRYIRIRCLENWSGNTNMVFSEVTFWGNDK
ncbi:DUF5000 domain-containing lipoprotein [Dawidia soli]|uniref:DUF4959 domain-containing protein n=1 Tax=Dawidia soli TaxID=2782352 RepID=A0AAP2D598_9BACT|nr:DUF5000 domain-containing lipoprotein [Dawidia soli]MBT1685606.1 DUF4959 domain-containing protein [Dawidia soli]